MKHHPIKSIVAGIVLGVLFCAVPSAWAEPETYRIDPVHSSLVFRIGHLGISYFYGVFRDLEGTLTIDPENVANSSVELSVKTEKIETRWPDRDKHVKSRDFLDVEKHPAISFKSASFKKIEKDLFEAAGTLALHGTLRPLTVRVRHIGSGKDPWGGYRTGYETSFTIKRSDFGMDFMLDLVGDDVLITMSVEGIRQ